MKAFSFNRFKIFAIKHYAEYGRNYKFALLALLAVEVIGRLLHNWTDDVVFRDLPYLMAYTLMVTYCTKWSLGGMSSKNSIVDMTLPINSIERYTFVWLNSYLFGVLAPTFILSPFNSADNIPAVLVAMTFAHAVILFVASIGSKRAFGWLVFIFFVIVIGQTTLFEQLDTFLSYGYDKYFSILPNGNNVYMSNAYEAAEGCLVYRWDIMEPIAGWIHLVYNSVIVLALYAASYFKIRERRL
jgi:hypothetical protein